MEFKDYVRMVLAHWVGVVVLIALGVLAAVAYNQTQPAVYQATATGYVTARVAPDPNADPNVQMSNSSIGDALAKSKVTSYLAIATSTRTAKQVIDDAEYPELAGATPGSLIGRISVSQPTDTVLINVSARGATPELAQHLADAWAQGLSEQIAKVEGSTPDEGLHMQVYSSAQRGAQVLPRTQLNLVVGLVLGMLLGFAYALIRKQFDRRLRNSEDVQKQFGVPGDRADPPVVAGAPGRRPRAVPGRHRRRGQQQRQHRRGVPQAAHQPGLHGRRPPAADHRGHQPEAVRRQVDHRGQPRRRHRHRRPAGHAHRRRPAPADRCATHSPWSTAPD